MRPPTTKAAAVTHDLSLDHRRSSLRSAIQLSSIFAFVLALAPLSAQSDERPGALAGMVAEKCSGSLGALIPECQAAKSRIAAMAVPIPPSPAAEIPAITGTTVRDTATHALPLPATVAGADSPNEFQRFAASSAGSILPIYGRSLFDNVPTTFAPLERVPVTSDYVIGPGDEIVLHAWGQINLSLDLTVDRTGAIYIPHVGNVVVAGLEFQQIHGRLKSALDRVYRNFELDVNMGQLRSIQIFVMGQARRPGSYTVSSLSTLVNALFVSGGPTALGSMRRIQLKRGNAVAGEVDLYDLLLKGDKSGDVRLLPGDMIFIPTTGPQVAVVGSIRNSAIFELKAEKTIADLLELAGGLAPTADTRRATLERINGKAKREVLGFALDAAGKAIAIGDADILHVNSITAAFDNAVTLRGNVANPGRFTWHEGLTLRDIIPDRDSLVTRAYWTRRDRLGFSAPQDPEDREEADAAKAPKAIGLAGSVAEINWLYATIERLDPHTLTTELIPFSLDRLILQNDATQNLKLRPGDVVTIFSQDDIRIPQNQRSRYVRLEGEVTVPGIYLVKPGETLGQVIQRAGGLTPQAYLFGSEFLRESTREHQQKRMEQFTEELERQLESVAANTAALSTAADDNKAYTSKLEAERRVLDKLRRIRATGRIVLNLEPGGHDEAKLMALALEDGDRFSVPTRPATVNVLGSVYNQSAFVHEPARTLGDYVNKAGGYTRNADRSHVLVIRANGSLVPMHGNGAFKPSFESATRLQPGDSVVVPENLLKGTFMRGLRDWSQIFSQFGLAAAAINVLK